MARPQGAASVSVEALFCELARTPGEATNEITLHRLVTSLQAWLGPVPGSPIRVDRLNACWPHLAALAQRPELPSFIAAEIANILGRACQHDRALTHLCESAAMLHGLLGGRANLDNAVFRPVSIAACYMLPRAMEYIALHPDDPMTPPLWASIAAIKTAMVRHMASPHASVCLCACAFLKTTILEFSGCKPAPPAGGTPPDPDLLAKDALAILILLLRKLNSASSERPASVITGILSLLYTVVLARPCYAALVVDAIVYFYTYDPYVLPQTQRRSIKHLLKTIMRNIVLRVPGPWNDILHQCLAGNVERGRGVRRLAAAKPIEPARGQVASCSFYDGGIPETATTPTPTPVDTTTPAPTPETTQTTASLALSRILRAITARISAAHVVPPELSPILALVARFASRLEPNDVAVSQCLAMVQAFLALDHTAAAGHRVMMTWLYCEHDRGRREGAPPTRYHALLRQLIPMLRPRADAVQVGQTFLEVPAFAESLYDELKHYCRTKTSEDVGLAALRDLAMQRPGCRARALAMLLEETNSPDKVLREKALKALQPLLTIPTAAAAVLARCHDMIAHLARLQTAGEETAPGTAALRKEDAIAATKRWLALPLAMATASGDILQRIADLYAGSTPKFRLAITARIPGLVQAAGRDNAAVLALLQSRHEAAIHNFLVALVEANGPTPAVVRVLLGSLDGGGRDQPDATLLISLIPGLTRDQAVQYLPIFVSLPQHKLRAAIRRLIAGEPSPMTPAEVFYYLHVLDTADGRSGAKLRDVIAAIEVYFEEAAQLATHTQVLGVVLHQLVGLSPLPPTFLRTLLLTLAHCPSMRVDVLNLLSMLVAKRVWEYPMLWPGFLITALRLMPQAMTTLMQLPPEPLARALQHTGIRAAVLNEVAAGRMLPRCISDALSAPQGGGLTESSVGLDVSQTTTATTQTNVLS